MEQWVFVIAIAGQLHGLGLYSTERNCWRMSEMISKSEPRAWVGRCVTLEEFHRLFPDVRLDYGS